MQNITELESSLGYTFKNQNLLITALQHSSYVNKKKASDMIDSSNERLEFLGDRVLGMVMAEYVYNFFKNEDEGVLSWCIAYLNSSHMLNTIAQNLELEKFLYVHDVVITNSASKIYANTLEAVLAAIYLDSDFDTIQKIIVKLWKPYVTSSLSQNIKIEFNPKSLLQEWVQKNNLPIPVYEDYKREGSEHEPVFYIKLKVKGYQDIIASSFSKKEAQKEAAKEFIKVNNIFTKST